VDQMTFFEIDPLVVDLATTRRHFTYATDCAHGHISFVTGDARLSLANLAHKPFDLLLIDAFSSDAPPAHLLTTEAMRIYLDRLRADGLLLLHVSNRHMDLTRVALAAARAAGGEAAAYTFRPND